MARALTAWLTATTGVAAMAAAAVLELRHGGARDMSGLELGLTCAAIAVNAVFGVRVLVGRPTERMGWLLVLSAFAGGTLTLAEVYAFDALVRHDGPRWGARAADALASGSWVVALGSLAAIALLFPDGALPGPSWRPLAWGSAVAFPAAAALVAVQPGPQDDPFEQVPNPAGVEWVGRPAGQVLTAVVMVAMLGCSAGCFAAMIDRFVAADGERRDQLKVVLFAGSLAPLAYLGCLIGRQVSGSDAIAADLLPFALVAVPAAVGAAVLRFRLYDVDRLINRSAVYLLLSAAITVLYLAVVWTVGLVGSGRTLATAAATAVAVAAFRPLRDVTQVQIDGRFARPSARARALLRAFTENLRHGRATPADLQDVLVDAFGDPELRLGFEPAGEDWVPLGTAYVRSEAVRPGILLHTVLTEGALALEVARLDAEVRTHSAYLAEARIRIAQAGFEERRRVERDLHDGVQQRLVSLGIQLRRLQRSLPAQAQLLAPALDAAVDEIGSTIADLRRLTAGQVPAAMSGGLAAALGGLAAGLPIPLQVEVTDERLPARLEAAAYFVACEGITNAVKHSRAGGVSLRAFVEAGALHVLISDDGCGGANAEGGTGLAGLADRVGAHGGTLEITSPPGRGTTLRAVLPCVS